MTLATPATRDERIAALGFDYGAQSKRDVTQCNLCGATAFVVLTHRDRYRFAAEAHGCLRCGLVFLNPVMDAPAYGRFYAGTYRPLVSAYHGRLIDARTIQEEQRGYAADRAALVAPFLEGRRSRAVLDIGGSTGVVAAHFAHRFGLEAVVVDPAPLEVEEARKLGLETVTGFVEDYDPAGRTFDLVLLCQTIDHLLDVASALAAIRRLIAADGLLFVDIVDFRAAYLRNRSVEEAVKIDHPYYLTEATAAAYLQRAGFEIVRMDYAADHLHVGYVCRPAPVPDLHSTIPGPRPPASGPRSPTSGPRSPAPGPWPPAPGFLPDPSDVAAQWREIRHVQNAGPPL
jgi:SAM-dependent methyltransferase